MSRLHLRPRGIAIVMGLSALAAAHASPDHWAGEINQLTRNDATDPVAPGGTLFVGSSSIRMWQSLQTDFPGRHTLNRGFGGSEIADSVYYFDRIVLPYHPAVVVFYAGDNDIAAGKSPEQVLADFRDFRARLYQALPDTWLVFLSIKECPARADKIPQVQEANRLIAADCREESHCRFVDLTSTLRNPDGSFRLELFQPDHLHLTPAGYAAWTKVLRPVLDQLNPLP